LVPVRLNTGKKHFNPHKCIPLVFFVFLFIFIFNQSAAADKGKNISQIQDKLRSKLNALKENSRKEKSVSDKLENINKNIKEKEKELNYYNRRISQTGSEIKRLSDEINQMSSEMENKMDNLREVIITFYKRQYDSNALILLSADDYQDLIKKMKYASLIAHYDGNVINQYGEEIKRINEKKKELESLHEKFRENKDYVRGKKNKLSAESQEKDKLLAKLKAKRNAYEKKIKELDDSSKKVRTMLTGIKTKKIPKSIIGNGFKALKGQLPWPVSGQMLIPYGKTKKIDGNTTAFKSGVEIRTKSENVPEVIAGGRVVYADAFKGYGKLVIVDHGDGYHSLYGNLSEVSLDQGNIVIQGLKVGKIMKAKAAEVPTLYFEIRHRGKPIDPVKWLKRQSRKKS
jgi:septal ring factor EnvC (AmiA/AmiB activator)